MDQLVGMLAAQQGGAGGEPDDRSNPPTESDEEGGQLRWDDDVEGQRVPTGILAGVTKQSSRMTFADLGDFIEAIAHDREGDDDPKTNPWMEDVSTQSLGARLKRKALESQEPLFNEAVEDYHSEIAAAREKAEQAEIEMTSRMELLAGVKGATHWWEEMVKEAKGKGYMTGIGAGTADEKDVATKVAERAARIVRRRLANAELARAEKHKPKSKWDKAKLLSKKKTEASRDHAKTAAKAWRVNAKLATVAKAQDPADVASLSLPPLTDGEGGQLYGAHPAMGLLPAHVLKHVTMRAGLGNVGAPGAGVEPDEAPAPPPEGTSVGASLALQGRPQQKAKVHNRELLEKLANGNWEERIAYLQYELKRPPSAGAGANSASKVGATSRYRRWGRLGATGHLNALMPDEAEGEEAKTQKRPAKSRSPRKPPLPDVGLRRTRARGSPDFQQPGALRPGHFEAAHHQSPQRTRRNRGVKDRRDEQRVLTTVYLGSAAAEAAEEEVLAAPGDEQLDAEGAPSIWFQERTTTPGNEYFDV